MAPSHRSDFGRLLGTHFYGLTIMTPGMWRCFVSLRSTTESMDPRYTQAMASTVYPRITIELGKCGGKPCIRGMRIRVSDVLELLANGAPVEELLADYPCLEREDILAAIAYAAQQTNHVVVEVA